MRKEQEHPKRNVEKPLFWQYLLEIPDPPSFFVVFSFTTRLMAANVLPGICLQTVNNAQGFTKTLSIR